MNRWVMKIMALGCVLGGCGFFAQHKWWMHHQPQSATVAACLRNPSCHDHFFIAHRARCGENPENSLSGIRCAATHAPIIEVDVRLTADHTPVLMHDPTLDRTTTCRGTIADFSLTTLRDCHLEDHESVPTLDEATKLCQGTCVLFLDLKTPAATSWILTNEKSAVANGEFIFLSRARKGFANSHMPNR